MVGRRFVLTPAFRSGLPSRLYLELRCPTGRGRDNRRCLRFANLTGLWPGSFNLFPSFLRLARGRRVVWRLCHVLGTSLTGNLGNRTLRHSSILRRLSNPARSHRAVGGGAGSCTGGDVEERPGRPVAILFRRGWSGIGLSAPLPASASVRSSITRVVAPRLFCFLPESRMKTEGLASLRATRRSLSLVRRVGGSREVQIPAPR